MANLMKFTELVGKLKEIFQIDKPDLDFGIYRILRARQKEVNEFLEKRLREKVLEALGGANAAEVARLEGELATQEANARALNIADVDMVPAIKELKGKIAAAKGTSEDDEADVYSHLLRFFSRYYEDGDFIAQRRYNGDVYALPYAGEEVKLYWANADQYYIKSGENFTNYDFTVDSLSGKARIHFRLVSATTAKDNVKDLEKRVFRLWEPSEGEEGQPKDFLEETGKGELTIYFQYLAMEKGTKQEALIAEAVEKVEARLAGMDPIYQPLRSAAPTEKDKKRTVLGKHLQVYTAKNTSDYFIHKDLKGFLTRELDFYIKNEMMHLDDIQEAETVGAIEKNLRKIQVVRKIAADLICFMAQLEEFQKKLWLKKKFVTRCEWCITMDRVPEELRGEVLKNKAQLAEWKRLGTERAAGDGDFFGAGVDARMVDTKFFDEGFKAKLLAAIPDLEEQTDGVIIRSENFQALRLLQARYRGKVKCIYIDPPYNTEKNEFPYKDGYKHSTWLALMNDRLREGNLGLSDCGVIFISIDDHELKNLQKLSDNVYGESNILGVIILKTATDNNGSQVTTEHEYMLCIAKRADKQSDWKTKSVAATKIIEQFRKLKAKGLSNEEIQLALRKWIKSNKSELPQVAHYNNVDDKGVYSSSGNSSNPHPGGYMFDILHPKTGKPCPKPMNGWRWPESTFWAYANAGEVEWGVDESTQPHIKKRIETATESLRSLIYEDNRGTTKELADLFGGKVFDNPKPHHVLSRIINFITTQSNELVLDYFGGSGTTGHAVIALNREDGGKRKYILVEMGEHFETVLKPRLEKVVYSPDWKDGKAVRAEKGISHCFKYLYLESYEDALTNLESVDVGGLPRSVKDEYILKYMLDLSTRGSVMNTGDFLHPFGYTLEIGEGESGASVKKVVDLVETFNYLMGFEVKHEIRRIVDGLILLEVKEAGAMEGEKMSLVIWRDVEKVPTKALEGALKKLGICVRGGEYGAVYVNGDHGLANRAFEGDGGEVSWVVKQIEEEFLTRMFEEV